MEGGSLVKAFFFRDLFEDLKAVEEGIVGVFDGYLLPLLVQLGHVFQLLMHPVEEGIEVHFGVLFQVHQQGLVHQQPTVESASFYFLNDDL